MKKHSRPIITIGISSLLLIFVSLCLFTFAILSLVSARADYRLSSKIADRTTNYYEASGEAYQRIAQIDDILQSVYLGSNDQEAFFAQLPETFSAFADVSYDSADQELSFQVSVNDTQILSICLLLHFPMEADDVFYSIRQWQTINITDWTPDTQQNLYIQPAFS